MKRRRRVPIVLQMEATECGAASLAMVLAYHNAWIPLEKLREECGVSRDGSKALNIVRAARQYGMVAKGYRHETSTLGEVSMPAIIHWNFNHFLVLEAIDGDRVTLADPAVGRRTVDRAQLDQSFTGVVLVLTPGETFVARGKPPRPLGVLLERLASLRSDVALLTVLSTILIVPGFVLPTVTQVFIDDVLVNGRRDWFFALIAVVIGIAILTAVLSSAKQRVLQSVFRRLSIVSTGSFVWHALRLPMPFYQARFAGDLTHRAAANAHIARVISDELAVAGFLLIKVLVFGALLFAQAPAITAVILSFAALELLAGRALAMKIHEANLVVQIEGGKVAGLSMNGLRNIETIKASGAENDFFSTWAGHFAKEQNAASRVSLISAWASTLPTLVTGLVHAAIFTMGGLRVMDGTMTVGALVAFETLVLMFLAPIHQLVHLWGIIQSSDAELRRVDDVMEHPAAAEATTASSSSLPVAGAKDASLSGLLEVRDLTFGYARLEPPLVEQVSFVVKPGERVALVGGSGSGKSTVLRLIAGLYTPWSGDVLFDGRRRQEWPRGVLTRDVAFVDQTIFQFEGTVRENLSLWDTTATDAAIVNAAKDADIHGIITERSLGYDTAVTEGGGNFSGGQRQRLEIARALVSEPALVLFDEATSALDVRAEHAVDSHVRRRGCACLIVAHRLSTILDCDMILVMDRGRLVESGTHDELIAKGGHYARLMGSE